MSGCMPLFILNILFLILILLHQHYQFLGVVNASNVQGGSNMTGTDLCVNKPHCAAAVRT